MGKRKVFTKTDLSVPQIEHGLDTIGNVVILPEAIPPKNTMVTFGHNSTNTRGFDFARWYGVEVDAITYACQRQIERFLVGQDSTASITTVVSYCNSGLCRFLDYCVLQAMAFERTLTLNDVNRMLIDGYLGHLFGQGTATTNQKSCYAKTKSVLLALAQRGLFPLVTSGDEATFPRNPFPNSNRKSKGETALSKRERQGVAAALRQAIKPLWNDDTIITGDLLVFALLVIALHTGRNTTPLLEMGRNCLRPHPKDDTVFLVLWKRRGYNFSKVALRAESKGDRVLEAMPAVRINVERLIRRVMALTEPLDLEAPGSFKGRVWLYRNPSNNKVVTLQENTLNRGIGRLVVDHGLKDSDGKPLRINISRLRKTFANRIFELTDGDLATTASALGNTPRVADQNYLAPSESARRNWQFMGEILVEELLAATIGATYKENPLGRCADPVNGQFAPKREGATCMNFMNCLRCKHYVVTAEDLYKLFSFYFRVLAERSRMDKRRWAREYAHIPRLIDHYIIAEGLRRGTFKAAAVDDAREHARTQPHPFWSVDLIDSLEAFMNDSTSLALPWALVTAQPGDVRGLPESERDRLIITATQIEGRWVILSRYGDDIWHIEGFPSNTPAHRRQLNFSSLPQAFRVVMKAMVYRYIRRGRRDAVRPKGSTIRDFFSTARLFLRHLEALKIERLSAITPMIAATYVTACKAQRVAGSSKPLSVDTLRRHYMTVEAIHELSHYTDDEILRHPWPDTSAKSMAGGLGMVKAGKTPLIPDAVFCTLFEQAHQQVERGKHLLDLRDDLHAMEAASKCRTSAGINYAKNRHLNASGWEAGLSAFSQSLLTLRTACYVVLASTSGCRNHELANLQSSAHHRTEDDQGTIYHWMRSRSEKTDAGVHDWMIPEAAVRALRVMERWSAPYQAMIVDEINQRRRINPHDPQIVEAYKHRHSLFLGVYSQGNNRVRTLTNSSWDGQLKSFAKDCGLN